MINEIFMLFDRVSQSYVGSVMLLKNRDVAKRSLKSLVNDSNFPFYAFKEDLQIFSFGQLNLSTGKIDNKVEFICNVSDLTGDTKNE